jgi:hypothetical protein
VWPWDAFPRPHSFRAGQKSGPRAFGSARFRLPGYVISIARLSNSGGFSHSPFLSGAFRGPGSDSRGSAQYRGHLMGTEPSFSGT